MLEVFAQETGKLFVAGIILLCLKGYNRWLGKESIL